MLTARSNLKPGEPDREIDVALRRGLSIRGRVVGPDGQSVPGTLILSRLILQVNATVDGRSFVLFGAGRARDGRFAVHGLEATSRSLPTSSRPGASSAPRPGSRAGRARASRSPSGSSHAHGEGEGCVNPEGKPLDRYPAGYLVTMIITPGPPDRGSPVKDDSLYADESILTRLDSVNYGTDFQSDAQGRLAFPR